MQQFCNCTLWLTFLLLIFTITWFLLYFLEHRYMNLQYFRYSNYENERQNIINYEKWQQFASAVKLNENEEKLNRKLMELKILELERWQNNVTLRKLKGNFIKMRPDIQKSLLYRILKIMPKGAALQVHQEALVNQRFLLNLTYEKDLWLCVDALSEDYELLRFSLKQPIGMEGDFNITCKWQLLKDLRLAQGDKEINLKLKKYFTLNSLGERSKDKLGKITQLIKGLITFVPVWHKYLDQRCLAAVEDNVQYFEGRSSLPMLYDLHGNNYTNIVKIVEMIRNSSKQMARTFENFYGSKLIYSLPRHFNETEFDLDLHKAFLLNSFYPDFLIGIDLINDPYPHTNSRPLKEFSSRLLKLQNHLDFYLTTSHLNWYDSKADEEIVESYLLGTKRITFHKVLLHHPYIIAKLVRKHIAIIINPIADQVFNNLADLRDHPAYLLFHYNLPLVIGSDYSAYWKADLLTFDFYMVFMHIAPREGDLRVLKQLALNSIYYSSLEDGKKVEILRLWQFLWYHWIARVNQMFI